MKKREDLSEEFLQLLDGVSNKRARVVIDRILTNGYITTEEILEAGYRHAPRAAADVRDLGIPLETFRVPNSEGKRIGAYKFGDLDKIRNNVLQGRKTFPKDFKKILERINGPGCEIDGVQFNLRYLQIDHRVPYGVAGDSSDISVNPEEFMLLCTSCNRAKSWSCEHCRNFTEIQDHNICRQCYWFNPDDYSHIAMEDIRRLSLVFRDSDVETYDDLLQRAYASGLSIEEYVLQILGES